MVAATNVYRMTSLSPMYTEYVLQGQLQRFNREMKPVIETTHKVFRRELVARKDE